MPKGGLKKKRKSDLNQILFFFSRMLKRSFKTNVNNLLPRAFASAGGFTILKPLKNNQLFKSQKTVEM